MKERPIIFSTEMVRAILDGRKTQTRRVSKAKPRDLYSTCKDLKCPYGLPGDRLWVRETWKWEGDTKYTDIDRVGAFYYKADDKENIIAKWKSSRFMPKEAARLFLEITNIRIERLCDINEVDAKQEGVSIDYFPNYKKSFIRTWCGIHKSEDAWINNPWVWVIEFKRING